MASPAPAVMPPPRRPAEPGSPRRRWLWWLGYGLLLLAILALAAFLMVRRPEVTYRAVPGPGPDPRQVQELDQSRAHAKGLRDQIAALSGDLATAACPPGTAPGAVPPVNAAPPASSAVPGEHAAAQPGDAGRPLEQRALVDRLNHAVVLVLTEKSSASGFFITPDHIVTNRHVAEDAAAGKVWVTSKTMGRVHQGRVVAMSPGGPSGSADYAIVLVPGANSAAMLPLTSSYETLTPIVSAGYPGLTVMNDAGFRALLAGDASAAPELVLRRGEVQAVQHSAAGQEVLVHSGDILQGNSGGPVVDACGRVVGINTYIAVDAQQSGKVSYALAARGLDAFLQANQLPVPLDSGPCKN